MVAGGIPDKLGNRYEAKWLVYQFLLVLQGQKDWIVFEGLSEEFAGFEFAVGKGSVTEWHQTKKDNGNRNWTINALDREGVLKSFSRRLAKNGADECFFVSQSPARTLSRLTEHTLTAGSAENFRNTLARELEADFDQLKRIWSVDDTNAYRWLRLIPVHPLRSTSCRLRV